MRNTSIKQYFNLGMIRLYKEGSHMNGLQEETYELLKEKKEQITVFWVLLQRLHPFERGI